MTKSYTIQVILLFCYFHILITQLPIYMVHLWIPWDMMISGSVLVYEQQQLSRAHSSTAPVVQRYCFTKDVDAVYTNFPLSHNILNQAVTAEHLKYKQIGGCKYVVTNCLISYDERPLWDSLPKGSTDVLLRMMSDSRLSNYVSEIHIIHGWVSLPCGTPHSHELISEESSSQISDWFLQSYPLSLYRTPSLRSPHSYFGYQAFHTFSSLDRLGYSPNLQWLDLLWSLTEPTTAQGKVVVRATP